MPPEGVERWRLNEQRQIIALADVVGVLVAIQSWGEQPRDADILLFIDNDAAWCGLIDGRSPHLVSHEIIRTAKSELLQVNCRHISGVSRVRVTSPMCCNVKLSCFGVVVLPISRRCQSIFIYSGKSVWRLGFWDVKQELFDPGIFVLLAVIVVSKVLLQC